MKKFLFRCRECGHEFRLQAWRAVCPNCNKTNSLVRVVEPTRNLRMRPRIFITILLLTYATYSIFSANFEPAPPINFYLYQIFVIGAALFALSGSLPSNALSVILGGLIVYSHSSVSSINYYNIIFIVLGVTVAILGILDELIIRHSRKRI